MTVWSDAIGTVWPGRDSRDRPLLPLLVLLTVVAGLIDAASYLNLAAAAGVVAVALIGADAVASAPGDWAR